MHASGEGMIPGGGAGGRALERTLQLIAEIEKHLITVAAAAAKTRAGFAGTRDMILGIKQALLDLRNVQTLQTKLFPKQVTSLVEPMRALKTLAREVSDSHLGLLGRVRQWHTLVTAIQSKYAAIATTAAAVHGAIPQGFYSRKSATETLHEVRANQEARAAVTVARMRRQRSGALEGGPQNWSAGLTAQLTYWGRLRILFGAMQKITKGARSFIDMEGVVSRAVRTAVKDTSNYNEVQLAREQILRGSMQYLTQHRGTIKEYTEAVYKLTEAEMSRNEALKLAPTIMSLSVGLDAPIEATTQLLVGLNELYKTSIPGTDSSRMNKFAGMLALASKKEMASVQQLTAGVSYFGVVANQVGMPIQQLIALIAKLNTNMLTGSKAGTGLRQALNSIVKHADKLQSAFGISIDRTKPLDTLDILRQLRPQLEGAITTDTLQNLLGVSDVRALPSILLASRQAENINRLAGELKSASLENVFSMRDIMETNVPAQLEILSKNFDYLIGAFLRGAIGGDRMAQSLAHLNRGMATMQPVALAAGKTIRGAFTDPTLLGVGAIYGALKLVQWRIAAVAKAAAAAQAAGTAFNAGGATLAALGGPAGIAGIALLAAGGVAYAAERRRANLERAVEDSSRAEDAYRSQSEKLRDMADALDTGAASTDQFAKAQELLGRSVADTSGNIAAQVKSAKELALNLREQADVLARMARIEGRNVVSAIVAKRTGTGIAPGWARGVAAAFAPVAGEVAKAVESTRDLSDLLDDLQKLRDFGNRAGMTRGAIKQAAQDAAAPTRAQLAYARAQAQRLLTPGSGVAVAADQRGGVLQAVAQLDDAARVVTGALDTLFTVEETKAAQATAQVSRYAETLRNLRDQIADYDPSIQDRLQLIEREDITDVEKYRRSIELLTEELKRLDQVTTDARAGAAGIADPRSKDELAAASKQIKAFAKEHAKASEDRYHIEQQIAALRLDAEKRVAAAQAETAKRQSAALDTYRSTITRLNSEAGKINQQLLSGAAEIGQRLFVGVDRSTGTGKDKRTVRFRGAAAAKEIAANNLMRFQNAQIIRLMQRSGLHDAFAKRLAGAGLGEADTANMMGAFRSSPSLYWQTQRAGAKSTAEGAAIAEQEQRFAKILADAYADAQRTGTPMPPLATLTQQGLPGLANFYAGGRYSANLQDETFWQQLGGKGDATGGLIAALGGNQTELGRNSAALAALTATITGRAPAFTIDAPWKNALQPANLPPAMLRRPDLPLVPATNVTIFLDGEKLGQFMVNSAGQQVVTAKLAERAATQAAQILTQAAAANQRKTAIANTTNAR